MIRFEKVDSTNRRLTCARNDALIADRLGYLNRSESFRQPKPISDALPISALSEALSLILQLTRSPQIMVARLRDGCAFEKKLGESARRLS